MEREAIDFLKEYDPLTEATASLSQSQFYWQKKRNRSFVCIHILISTTFQQKTLLKRIPFHELKGNDVFVAVLFRKLYGRPGCCCLFAMAQLNKQTWVWDGGKSMPTIPFKSFVEFRSLVSTNIWLRTTLQRHERP